MKKLILVFYTLFVLSFQLFAASASSVEESSLSALELLKQYGSSSDEESESESESESEESEESKAPSPKRKRITGSYESSSDESPSPKRSSEKREQVKYFSPQRLSAGVAAFKPTPGGISTVTITFERPLRSSARFEGGTCSPSSVAFHSRIPDISGLREKIQKGESLRQEDWDHALIDRSAIDPTNYNISVLEEVLKYGEAFKKYDSDNIEIRAKVDVKVTGRTPNHLRNKKWVIATFGLASGDRGDASGGRYLLYHLCLHDRVMSQGFSVPINVNIDTSEQLCLTPRGSAARAHRALSLPSMGSTPTTESTMGSTMALSPLPSAEELFAKYGF